MKTHPPTSAAGEGAAAGRRDGPAGRDAELGTDACLGVAARAGGEVRAANGRALAEVRRRLAPPAAAAAGAAPGRPSAGAGGKGAAPPDGIAPLIDHFQRLVAADGPLPFVRFAAAALAAARRAAAERAAPGQPADADACLAHLAQLAPGARDDICASLQTFVAQPFVPPDDRLAAVAALATWWPEARFPLALRAVFAAQLAELEGPEAAGSAASGGEVAGQGLHRLQPE